jgi:hypothetical protein
MRKNSCAAANPLKFEEDRLKIILEAIAKGIPKRHASALARISNETLLRWEDFGKECQLKIDEGIKVSELEQRFANFVSRMREAELTFIGELTENVRLGSVHPVYLRDKKTGELILDDTGRPYMIGYEGDWRAASFLLERRYPQDFGQTSAVKVEASGGLNLIMDKDLKGV